jgi:hypothetical protein
MLVLLVLDVIFGRVTQSLGNQSPNFQNQNQKQSQKQNNGIGGNRKSTGNNNAHTNRCTNSQYDYNCAGLAFQTCTFIGDMNEVARIYSKMERIECNANCKPFQYKVWYWPHRLSTTDRSGRQGTKPHADFHTVGGKSDSNGRLVKCRSKNGHRILEAPRACESFEPRTGDAYKMNNLQNLKVPNQYEKIENLQRLCYCSDTLPNKSGNGNGGQQGRRPGNS